MAGGKFRTERSRVGRTSLAAKMGRIRVRYSPGFVSQRVTRGTDVCESGAATRLEIEQGQVAYENVAYLARIRITAALLA